MADRMLLFGPISVNTPIEGRGLAEFNLRRLDDQYPSLSNIRRDFVQLGFELSHVGCESIF
jgi:hypothetical protein